MAVSRASKEYSNFSKGLVTEASPLLYPEGAAKDINNVVLNRDGSIYRRLGVDRTTTTALCTLPERIDAGTPFSYWLWKNVAGDAGTSFLVFIQNGSIVILDVSSVDDYSEAAASPVTVSGALSYTHTTHYHLVTFEEVAGRLVLASAEMDPCYLEYDADTSTVTVTQYEINIRDVFGMDDTLDTDERPTTNTDQHRYNLLNQGWDKTKIDATFTAISAYPSNADIWYVARNATTDAYDATKLDNQVFGTTPAPRGKYVLNLFEQDRQSILVDAGYTSAGLGSNINDHGRPSAIAFYAGRMWYGGIESDLDPRGGAPLSRFPTAYKNATLYYSQIVSDITDVGKCYQENDPTSEFTPGVLDTDGGQITIPNCGTILAMEELQTGLAVIATNGVWFVAGNPDSGFTPTDFSVKKVTNVGCISRQSIVVVEGTILYFTDSGIYLLQPDKVQNQLVAVNVTEASIASYYSDRNRVALENTKGVYDSAAREIVWLIPDDDTDGSQASQKYRTLLIYNLLLQAFYIHTVNDLSGNTAAPSTDPYIVGAFIDYKGSSVDYFATITNVAGTTVTTVAGTTLTTTGLTVGFRGGDGLQLLIAHPQGTGALDDQDIYAGKLFTPTFYDWISFNGTGVDSSAYIETGDELFGDSQRQKGAPYITTHLLRTETGFDSNLDPLTPSSCKMQIRWDWTNSTAASRWGTEQEVYRYSRLYSPSDSSDTFDTGYSTIVTKNRVRGRGRAFSLRFSSSEGKDMKLLGWAVRATGEQEV